MLLDAVVEAAGAGEVGAAVDEDHDREGLGCRHGGRGSVHVEVQAVLVADGDSALVGGSA